MPVGTYSAYLIFFISMANALRKALDEIAKKHGVGSAMMFEDFKNVEVERISCGLPSLDLILGGGIPVGRILEIYGPESSGKTTLAIKFLAECQKAYPQKKVAFIDVEHAFDPQYAGKLGLDMGYVVFSQPNSAEQALNIMADLAKTGEVSAIILDSIAQLIPTKEQEGDIGGSEMAMRARLMSQACRKIAPIAEKGDCTCFFINQVRSNVGVMYGNPETTPGGNAMKYAASVRIRTSFKKDGDDAAVKMQIKKNKVGKPFGETIVRLKYGVGFDVIDDVITTALKIGLIKKAGPMFSYADQKWKGEEACRKAIADDSKLREEIAEVIRNSKQPEAIMVPKDELSEAVNPVSDE